MRDPIRIDVILEYIRTLWKMNPDQRLGQLLVNAAPFFEDATYFYEDADLIEALYKAIEEDRNV